MNETHEEKLVSLGKTDVRIPPLGTGAWAWGDQFYWGFGGTYDESDVHGAFEASLEAGINFFDTAEIYGFGNSERLLGKFSGSLDQPILVATKFMPLPLRFGKKRLLSALNGSLRRLRMDHVDLYQIHSPVPLVSIEKLMEGMAEAIRQGLVRSVGVSNYSAGQMLKAQSALAAHGIPLASNQVNYSLVERGVERNGLLEACRQSGITLIAYSPLGKGTLTGKYSPGKTPSGMRSFSFNSRYLEKIQPLIQLMREIGENHGGRTPAQVALNWTICKGAVPIPGAKNARQATDNVGALGWRLSQDEVMALDQASDMAVG